MSLRYPSGAAKVNLAGFLLVAAEMVPDRTRFAATRTALRARTLAMPGIDRPDYRLRAEAVLILLLQVGTLLAALL